MDIKIVESKLRKYGVIVTKTSRYSPPFNELQHKWLVNLYIADKRRWWFGYNLKHIREVETDWFTPSLESDNMLIEFIKDEIEHIESIEFKKEKNSTKVKKIKENYNKWDGKID
ncbi:hypothetical protein Goe21_02890 [Bacillus phage vB_BsuM-Goe21]|nr:hypothetical protein Goe21_02890 [Bacillus phage vB_BsuM-Goe21]